jgi:ABC-type oligopeptide transport system substrate-binding subunit
VAASYLDDIVGVPEYAKGQAQHIAGIKALDERTLQVTIDAPKAYFLAKLTYPTAFVVDKTQVESQGDNWLRKPNGSGPFVLESLSRERIVLVRNEHYYGKRPILARVEYILSGGLPITMYENDQLDIVEVSPAEIERVSDPGNPLYAEHRVEPQLSVQYLGLNVDAPPFDDPAVRQAFAQAIDKNKLADLVLKNTALPAVGILPPGMPDYDQNLVGLPYDPVRARQLLASSKYAPAMPQVVLAVSGTSGHMDSVTRAILSMIESNLGITVTVEQVEWSYFLRDMNERRYQIYSAGWIGDYPDSQNFLDVLFHSQSSQNHMGYHNREADQLLEQARVEQDPAKRTTLYRQAERIIVNEAPWIPLTHGIQYTLVKPYVKGFRASAAIYPWLRDIYFEK